MHNGIFHQWNIFFLILSYYKPRKRDQDFWNILTFVSQAEYLAKFSNTVKRNSQRKAP